MTRRGRWAIPAVVLFLPLLVAGVAFSAGAGESNDVDHAKRMVELIREGQLNLVDATELAEDQSKGNALSVNCQIKRAGPASSGQATKERLVYDVTCFVKDSIQRMEVDGLTKEVRRTP